MESATKIKNKSCQLQASRRVIVCIVYVIAAILSILIILSFAPFHSVIAQDSLKTQYQVTDNAIENSIEKMASSLNNNNSLKTGDSILQDGSPLSITKTMRHSNESLPVAGETPYIASNSNYVFSQSKNEVSTPNNNSHTAEFGKGEKIAIVMPTFTASAYDNAFYVFYRKFINTPYGINITTDLNLLSNKVTNQFSATESGTAMLYLLQNLKWITPESRVNGITDQDVDAGTIFHLDGSNVYNIIILGHQEYVTQREYDNLKRFVGNGGSMIVLDGNVFYAEVKYDRNNNIISLVKGHGWAYNGMSAWRSVNERWRNETAQWVGSNYISGIAKFSNNPFSYFSHEEQYMTNPKDIILLNYGASTLQNTQKSGKIVVATYELNYLKGNVIAIGLYSDDIITNGSFDRYFDNLLYQFAFRIRY